MNCFLSLYFSNFLNIAQYVVFHMLTLKILIHWTYRWDHLKNFPYYIFLFSIYDFFFLTFHFILEYVIVV